jgi:hypothetical protein
MVAFMIVLSEVDYEIGLEDVRAIALVYNSRVTTEARCGN